MTREQIGRLIARKGSGGYAKLAAPPYEACPRCDAMNTDKKIVIWRVADERGATSQCDVCAHGWKRSG